MQTPTADRPAYGAWILLVPLAAVAATFARARFLAPVSFDEEYFTWEGWLILKGQVPYRDFFEPKPPVVFFGNALGLALWSVKSGLYRWVPTALAVVSVLVFYLGQIRRHVIPVFAWVVALVSAHWLLGPQFHDTGLDDTETYGLAFMLLGIGLARVPLGGRAWRIGAGVCFGLSVLSKELFLLSVVPAVALLAFDDELRWQWRRGAEMVVGGAAVALCFVGYLVATRALGPYVDMYRFYMRFADSYCLDIGRFPRVSGWEALHANWGWFKDWVSWHHLAPLVPLYAVAAWFLKRSRALALLPLGMLLGLYAVSVGHCFWRHYYLMAASGFLLPAVIGAAMAGKQVTRVPWAGRAALGLASASLLYATWTPLREAWQEPDRPFGIPLDGNLARAVSELTLPTDYILSLGTPFAYVATDRLNPLPSNIFVDEWVNYYPGATDEERLAPMRRGLEAHVPKIIYAPATFAGRQSRFMRALFQQFILEHGYRQVAPEIWFLAPPG